MFNVKLKVKFDILETNVVRITTIHIDKSLIGSGELFELEGFYIISDYYAGYSENTLWVMGEDKEKISSCCDAKFNSVEECEVWVRKAIRAIKAFNTGHVPKKSEAKVIKTYKGW